MKIMVGQEMLAPYSMTTTKRKKTAPVPTKTIATSTGQSPEEPLMNSRTLLKKTFRTTRAETCVMMMPKWLDQSLQVLWEHRILQVWMRLRSRI